VYEADFVCQRERLCSTVLGMAYGRFAPNAEADPRMHATYRDANGCGTCARAAARTHGAHARGCGMRPVLNDVITGTLTVVCSFAAVSTGVTC
jgi:hypothetical protein